jgi:hypothetical protein
MIDFFKDVGGSARVQAIVTAWLAPLLLGTFAFLIIELPEVRDSAVIKQVGVAVDLLGVNRFLFVFLAVLTLSTFLYLNRVFLYRVLEGEKWPWFLREWRRRRAHIPHHRYLLAKQQHARAIRVLHEIQASLKDIEGHESNSKEIKRLHDELVLAQAEEERARRVKEEADRRRQYRDRERKYPRGLGWLPRRRRPVFTPIDWRHWDDDRIPTYPADETDVMPTRIGNELRAMETYGYSNYRLDSQTLWYDLYGEAPDALRNAIDDSELQADTFVASLYATMGLSVAMIAGVLWKWSRGETSIKLLVASIVTAALLPVFHRGLLTSIDEWAATVRALVNNGRKVLREKYDLRLPASIEEEQRMWEALTGFIYYASDPHYAKQLDEFRVEGPSGGDGLLVQLTELGDLYQKGLLSIEEFATAKERLLRGPRSTTLPGRT